MATITNILKRIADPAIDVKEVTLVTHISKPHHADDVCATALLRILFEDLNQTPCKLVKTFTPAEDGYIDETEDTVIYDIGLGIYDHHQAKDNDPFGLLESRFKEDGSKYSSTGLIWKEIGHILVPEEYVDEFYNNVLLYIDQQDNGEAFNPLSTLIRHMNYYNEKNKYECFELSVNMMRTMFTASFNMYTKQHNETEEIKEIINSREDDICLVSDKYYAGLAAEASKLEIPFIVYPDARDNTGIKYSFKTVTPIDGEMTDHILDIPDEVRKWEGVTFLHPSCFLGTAVTKARAIEIVHEVYKNSL